MSPQKDRRFLHDHRASVHMLEVMIVSIMVVGAVVMVATMNNSTIDPNRNLVPMDDRMAQEVLDNQKGQPAKSTSVHYTNRLEELVIAHLMDDANYEYHFTGTTDSTPSQESDLERIVRTRGDNNGYRINFELAGKLRPLAGPTDHPYDATASGISWWASTMGTTIMEPTLSMHSPEMLVHTEILPAWMHRVHNPPGQAFEVTGTLEKASDGTKIEHTTTHHIRIPQTDYHKDPLHNPLMITPWDPDSGESAFVTEEGSLSGLGNVTWPLHFKFTPSNSSSTWLDGRTILKINRPPGWSEPQILSDDPDISPGQEGDWKRLNTDPEDPVWRLKYIGERKRGDGEAWLNFTIENLGISELSRQHHVSVQAEQPSWSQATAVITPTTATKNVPLTILASHTDPLLLGEWSTITFTLTNPLDESVFVKDLQVGLPGMKQDFVPDPDWEHGQTGEDAEEYLALIPEVHLGAREAESVELRIKIEEPFGGDIRKGETPIVEYLGADSVLPDEIAGLLNLQEHDPMVSVPYGSSGQFISWFDPNALEYGEHTLRAPMDKGEELPPGVGHFQVQADPDGVLPVLQQARSGMRLSVGPEIHAPGEPVQVRLDLGDLLPELRQLQDDGLLAEEKVSLTLESASLVDHLWGKPESVIRADLDLDWAAQIVGLDWTETGDLGVAYSDGHVLLLDGSRLPDVSLWRYRLADHVTAGPFWLEGNETVPDRLAVFGDNGTGSRLYLLDEQGVVKEDYWVGGMVEDAVVTQCQGGAAGLGFISNTGIKEDVSAEKLLKEGNASLLLGGSEGLGGWTGAKALFYRDGELVSGDRFAGYEGIGLDVGRFGPIAECSLVVGFDGLGEGGLLLRYPLGRWGEEWRQEVPEGVRGVYAGRVKEAPYKGLLNDMEVQQVITVTGDGGYEVFGGFIPMGHGGGHEFDLEVGDSLLGLSWVDHRTGYVASEGGHVWETRDGGRSWEELEGSPITEEGRTLEDFSFGGDGNGLFVQDDERVRFYSSDLGGFEPWEPPLADGDFLAMGETATEPGVILKLEQVNEVALRLWDPETQSLQSEDVLSLSCLCTAASGHGSALVGWNEDEVRANITGLEEDWVKPRSGDAYMVEPSGHLLEVRSRNESPEFGTNDRTGILVHDIITNTTIGHADVDSEVLQGLKDDLSASRNMHAASLMYGGSEEAGVLSLHPDGESLHRKAPDDELVTLSGGPGDSWWVLEDQVVPLSQPENHVFQVKASDGFSSDEVTYSLEFSPVDGGNLQSVDSVSWRVWTQDGPSGWKSGTDELSLDWEPAAILEVARNQSDLSAFGVPVLVVEPDDGGKQEWSVATSDTCEGCLVPVGDSRSLMDEGSSWLDPEGLVPGYGDVGLEGEHGFTKRSEALFLTGGGSLDEQWSHNVSLGLPWRGVEMSSPVLPHAYYRVPGPGGVDLLVSEQSLSSQGGSLLDLLPDLSQLQVIDPETGESCGFTQEDSWGLGDRVFLHDPDSAGFVMGSDLGRLTSMSACDQDWSASPLGVGSVLQFTIPTKKDMLAGPTIVQAKIGVDVVGLDRVDLNLLGHSYRSKTGESTDFIIMDTHLHYWLPRLHADDGWVLD